MTSYGPWQQDPDFLQFYTMSSLSGNDPVDGQPVFDYANSAFSTESGYQDPVYPITIFDLEAAVGQASTLGPSGTGTGEVSNWGTLYGWEYLLSFPMWDSVWSAESAHRSFRLTSPLFSYNPVNEGHYDPRAIGVDYANRPYDPSGPWTSAPAEPVSRSLSSEGDTRLGGVWYDDSGPEVSIPQNPTSIMLLPQGAGQRVTLAEYGPPAAPNLPSEPQYRTLDQSIDLTPYIADAGWAGTIWTNQAGFEEPKGNPGPYGSGHAYYGWGFDAIRIDTMVRPPLWRWVYDTAPYRRTSHRDDALAGGAGRNFPPSKAIQSGRRTSGGYI